jgi:hypothetical protein
VLLDVDNSDNALMAEMTTQVFFVAGAAKDVLTVPVAALQGVSGSDRQIARVVAANGSIEAREVRWASVIACGSGARRPARRRSPVDRPGRRQRGLR